MPDITWVKDIANMGVGLILGLVMFSVYRIDSTANNKRMSELIEQNNKVIEHDSDSRDSNTKILSELTILLRDLHNRMR